MKKEDVLSMVSVLVGFNNDVIKMKKEEIEKGGNKKSIESVICGINKNIKLLLLIGKCLNGDELNDDDVKLIERLSYKVEKKLREVSKKEVIENDLIDKVIIKKVNGENKYFIEE
jgi:hypothetical protein